MRRPSAIRKGSPQAVTGLSPVRRTVPPVTPTTDPKDVLRPPRRLLATSLTAALLSTSAATALAAPPSAPVAAAGTAATTAAAPATSTSRLTPRTRSTMKPDGSSGKTAGGEGIPTIDSVKKTFAVYYGDDGKGKADRARSPYVSELKKIAGQQRRTLKARYRTAVRNGEKPALVFDAHDTTLSTYDMEVAGMHFTFDPALQDTYVQGQQSRRRGPWSATSTTPRSWATRSSG
jgi:hypothetical protein